MADAPIQAANWSEATGDGPGGDGAATRDRVSVPGPGASNHLFGFWQIPPRHAEGTVTAVPGASWQLDRDTGTLNFYQQDADGNRTLARSLQVGGDGQVPAPNGQVLGRVHDDGGFELDRTYLTGLCPLPSGGFSPAPPLPSLPGLVLPPPPAGAKPGEGGFDHAPTLDKPEGFTPAPALPQAEQGPSADELQGPQASPMARPRATPEEIEQRKQVIQGKGLPPRAAFLKRPRRVGPLRSRYRAAHEVATWTRRARNGSPRAAP